MALSSSIAKQVCTKAELTLFAESLARNVKSLDAKATKSRVGRTRKLRDKYKGLADRQDREARGKQQARRRNPSQGSVQTRKKEQLFAESLERFEIHLSKLVPPKPRKATTKKTATTKKVVKKKAKNKTAKVSAVKKTATKKKVTKKTVRPKKPTSVKKTAKKNKKSPAAASRKVRIQKHVSSRNRRNQARRDKK